MKYSMNYYSKKNRKFHETIYHNPEISESSSAKEKRKKVTGDSVKDWNNFKFIVPWQLL